MVQTTNILAEHKSAFEALTSGEYSNFALFSCFVNGAPASAIISFNRDDTGDYVMTPLFVSVTEEMTLTDQDGVSPDNHSSDE